MGLKLAPNGRQLSEVADLTSKLYRKHKMENNKKTELDAQSQPSCLGGVISRFTMEDLDSCWNDYPKERLIDILNGDYSVEDAREDLRSLIGSKYDNRNGL